MMKHHYPELFADDADEAETEQLRVLGNAIKKRALSKLPQLLEQLESRCTQNGIRVHWAETTAEANNLVLDILRSHNATRLVKEVGGCLTVSLRKRHLAGAL
jgi:L-lactate utilization protein LutB